MKHAMILLSALLCILMLSSCTQRQEGDVSTELYTLDDFETVEMKDSIHYNQVSGKEMKAFFRNGEAYKIDVIGNVETIYYPLEKDSSILYQNKSVSSSLTMLLENQRMKQIKFYQKPDMVVTPIDQLKSDMKYLKDFKWFAELRPKDKWDIFRKISKKEEDKDTQKNRFQLDDWQ